MKVPRCRAQGIEHGAVVDQFGGNHAGHAVTVFQNPLQARAYVFEYIEVDYNRNRLHSTLGFLSPEQFELANTA